MENTKNDTNQKDPVNVAADEVAICFDSLGLGSSSNNGASTDSALPPVPASSGKLRETRVVSQESKGLWTKFDNSHATVQEFIPSGKSRPFSSAGSVPQENIWASQGNLADFRMNGQLENPVTPLNYVPSNSYGSVGDQTRFNFYQQVQSPVYRSPIQFNGLYNQGANGLNATGIYRPVMQNQAISPHIQVQNSIWNGSQVESSLPEFDFFALAMSRGNSEQLKQILRKGNSVYTQETLKSVIPNIFRLMNDFHGHVIFDTLVDTCDRTQLYAILTKFQLESGLFLSSTCCDISSLSIQRLIKRLKKTGLEWTITSLLSRDSINLMTHKTASHVIRHCFMYLGDAANQVLYGQLAYYFLELATDPVGCITVNVCIDSITDPKTRAKILELVANNASCLSNDPSGNYVLQRVLGLRNDFITEKICLKLAGQYVELAQRKSGSHVVEKCMESSEFGLSVVIDEIFRDNKNVSLLARDQFGNYVIQTALRISKQLQDKGMYKLIVQKLKPHYANLMHKPRGRYICNLIKDEVEELQKIAKSDQ